MLSPKITLGSLFDGSGGFPLAGTLVGITPIWSSEIELFPLRVTAARFPDVKQLGDVTKINGAEIDPVDIITFGSPCQDLSVAGKQKGIHDGERSNLFFEAVRIIKEMRDADKANGRSGVDIRPRFAVWENVPGAFSSNGGDDFKAVLEALAGVMQDGLDIPRPKKWNHAGGVAGDGWSIAWRVYDAQYWGVPQRRKRIYLVADFGSERAGEILFERESVCGNPAESGAAREGTAADAERSIGGSCGVRCYNESGVGYWMPGFGCLRAEGENRPSRPTHCVVESNGVRCLNPWDSQSIRQYDVNGVAPNINANSHGGQNRWGVCYLAAFMGGQGAKAGGIGYCDDGTTPTLKASPSGGNTVPDVCYALQGNGIDRADTAGCNGYGWRTDQMYTLNTIDRPAIAFQASGDRGNPSISVSDRAYCLAANPMSDRGQAVCFQQNQRDEARDTSLLSVLCYEGQNVCTDAEKAFTLQAGRPDQQHIPTVVYDARGNGDGNIAPTMTGHHNANISDYTAILVEKNE